MEEVWLKTEPIDDEFETDINIKLEDGGNTSNQLPMHPNIKENIENSSEECIRSTEYVASALQFMNDAKRKLPTEGSVSKAEQKYVEKVSQKRKFCCEECGVMFNQSYHLRRHKLIHSGEKPHVCSECGKSFTESFALKLHQLSHKGERRFVCGECGARFASKANLKSHQRLHTGELPFVCDDCGERFNYKVSLARHKLEHSGEKKFECDECEMKFYDCKLLKSHKTTHVAGEKPYTCEKCERSFYHKTSLNAHKRSHSVERPFGCEICGKRFTQNGTLTVHKAIHSDARPYECDMCGLQFNRKDTLKAHALKLHGRIPTTAMKRKKKVTSRPSINENFSAKFGLKEQLTNESVAKLMDIGAIKTTSPSSESQSMLEVIVDEFNDVDEKLSPYRGSIEMQKLERSDRVRCKSEPETIVEPFFDVSKPEQTTTPAENLKVLDSSNKKQRSKGSAENSSTDRPFSCEKCERKFALISALKNHQRSHSERVKKEPKVRSFICDECGKVFNKNQHLRIHQRTHSNIKPYTCDKCERSFTQRGNYTKHQRTHSGERPFSCDVCEKRFAEKTTLNKHMTSHTNDKLFGCELCGKKFAYESSVRAHKLTHFDAGKRFSCDECGKTFTENRHMKLHLQRHTGHKPFQCPFNECPAKFITNSDLRRHKKHCHRPAGEPSPYKIKKMMTNMMDGSLVNETV